MNGLTADELMVVCMSRQILDGETVVQGLSTPLVGAAYLLARRTHAPHLYFASAIGQSLCREPAPLTMAGVERLWLDRSLKAVGFVRVAADILPSLRPKEFFRPAQVDASGNFNNVAFGREYLETWPRKARLRLPGTGGIPDVTTYIDKTMLYVTRHSRLTFTPELDVRSGLGHAPERRRGSGPVGLVSDLGVFDFERGRMRLVSWHPWSSPAQIQAKTGFELALSPQACETPPPSPEELRLLREEIDPLGIRRLELLSGSERRELLRAILITETAQNAQ